MPQLRELIGCASVLGPEFPSAALATVSRHEDPPAALAELCSTGLLNQVRQSPEPVYRFRHALIHEAVYQGMTRNERTQLHSRAAWGLETLAGDRSNEVAAILGHHYAVSGDAERAAHYLELAGDQAAAVFANDEAITFYRRALSVTQEEGR